MKLALRLAASAMIAATLCGAALAEPRLYRLEGASSRVGFTTNSGIGRITGSLPVSDARLRLDFNDVSKSSVEVTLNAAGAKANSPFAASAMKGPDMLDTGRFPAIAFRSTRVSQRGGAVLVSGDLTIRGVTRPVSLRAALWRADRAKAGSLDHLRIRLTGAIRRSAFGANGFPDMVGDVVNLEILAQVARAD